MASTIALWTGVAGFTCLILALFLARKDLAAARGLDKLIALACVFYAAPLAAFGAEHLTDAADIVQLIPAWIPARVFLAYFVGVALIAAALSLSFRRCLRLTATLLAVMFFLFVSLMHIPGVLATRDRFTLAVALRDLSFGCGALALAGAMTPHWSMHRNNAAITVARILIGAVLIVYGVEHFLHPTHAFAVPLKLPIPAWVPLPHLWGYLVGAVLLLAGIALLLNRYTRDAALGAGLVAALVTLFLYFPILVTARTGIQVIVGLNYVFDTMLFAGTLLLLAAALSPNRQFRELSDHQPQAERKLGVA